MPTLLHDPVQHLLALLNTGTPRLLIGLAGLPGSGKSTLAAHLASAVNASPSSDASTMVALGMDGFHLTKAELRAMPDPDQAFARRGAPWTFDPGALRERLQQVRRAAGREVVPWPGFEHDIGDPVEGASSVSPTTRIVLIEGLYLLCDTGEWAAVSACFDERWYLDTPMDVAMARLTERHMQAWQWTRAAAEARIASNDRLNAALVGESRVRADWLVE